MSILPGFQKYKRHIRIGEDYILDSEWTHAETIEMSDGSTLDDTVANINREITATKKSVSDGKSTVASAITAQGVTTAADATFNVMAANVGKVGTDKYNAGYNAGVAATKVGTATAANVLSGKTFTNSSSVGISGTMPNQGAWTGATTGSENVAIPAGYHNGSGYVSGAGAYNAGYNAGKASATTSGEIGLYSGSGATISMGDGGTTFTALKFITTTDSDKNRGVQIYLTNASGANGVELERDRWWTKAEIGEEWKKAHSAESYSFDFITIMNANNTWLQGRITIAGS